jgi:hypothetical protein
VNSTPRSDDTAQYSEDQVTRILRRAVTIDATLGTLMNERALRDIAAELGVSSAAITQAIGEENQQPSPGSATFVSAPRVGKAKSFMLRALCGVVGFLTGAVSRLVAVEPVSGDVDSGTINAAVILGAAIVTSAFALRGRSMHRTFLVLNSILWLGFMAGWSIVHGSLWGDLVAVGITSALITSAGGVAIILWRSHNADR